MALPPVLDVHADGLVADLDRLRRAVGARRGQEELERAVRGLRVPPVERVLDLGQDELAPALAGIAGIRARPALAARHQRAVALEEDDADGHAPGGERRRLAGARQGAEADGELGRRCAGPATHEIVEHRRRRLHRAGGKRTGGCRRRARPPAATRSRPAPRRRARRATASVPRCDDGPVSCARLSHGAFRRSTQAALGSLRPGAAQGGPRRAARPGLAYIAPICASRPSWS